MLKLLFDTNVIVSAAMVHGKPRQLLKLGLDGRFVIISSDAMLEELDSLLQRPKFAHVWNEIVRIRKALEVLSVRIPVKSSLNVINDDPDDNVFINTAIDGRVDYIVTGDRHLLELQQFRWIKIVTVDEMLRKLGF